MHRKNYGHQSPHETKAYLELWAERLRLPDTITEHDKQEIVRYAQDLQEKHMTDTIKVNLTPVEQRMEEINHALYSPLPGDPNEFDPFFDGHGNLIDQNGEVIGTGRELEAVGEEDDIIIESSEPEHILRLRALQLPEEEKAALLGIYDTPPNLKQFKSYINKTVLLYGGIIWWHPPFRPLNSPEGTIAPGYKKIRFLTLEQGEPVIIEASFGSLSTHAQNLFNLRGWFLWNEPVEYVFGQNEKTNAFTLANSARVKTMLAGMAPAKKTK